MKTKLSNEVEIPTLEHGLYRVPTKGITKDCILILFKLITMKKKLVKVLMLLD